MRQYISKFILSGVGAILLLSMFLACNDRISNPVPRIVDYAYFRDYEYAQNRIFDLRPPVDTLLAADSIIDIAFFTQDLNPTGVGGYWLRANSFIDPREPSRDSIYRERYVYQQPVAPSQYWPGMTDPSSGRRYVVFKQSVREAGLGVWMRVKGIREGRDTTFEIGSITDSLLTLMMLRPSTNYVPNHPTWRYMWRNCYDIPAHMDMVYPEVQIFRGEIGTEPDTSNHETQGEDGLYLTLTGLDQHAIDGTGQPDGQFDFAPPMWRRDWGLIIFPNRTPFDTDTTFAMGESQTAPLQVRAPHIYRFRSMAEMVTESRYYFRYSLPWRPSRIKHSR